MRQPAVTGVASTTSIPESRRIPSAMKNRTRPRSRSACIARRGRPRSSRSPGRTRLPARRALRERRLDQLSGPVLLEPRTDVRDRAFRWHDDSECALALAPSHADEVIAACAAFHEDRVDLLFLHQALRLGDPAPALVVRDGDDAGGHGRERLDGRRKAVWPDLRIQVQSSACDARHTEDRGPEEISSIHVRLTACGAPPRGYSAWRSRLLSDDSPVSVRFGLLAPNLIVFPSLTRRRRRCGAL